MHCQHHTHVRAPNLSRSPNVCKCVRNFAKRSWNWRNRRNSMKFFTKRVLCAFFMSLEDESLWVGLIILCVIKQCPSANWKSKMHAICHVAHVANLCTCCTDYFSWQTREKIYMPKYMCVIEEQKRHRKLFIARKALIGPILRKLEACRIW